MFTFVVVLLGVTCAACITCVTCQTADDNARAYLDGYDVRASEIMNRYTVVSWEYYTNITNYNQQAMTNASLEYSQFSKNEAAEAANFDQSQMSDDRLKRQLNLILDVGISGYENETTLRRISDLAAEMSGIYSSAKWCKTPDNCMSLEPDLVDMFATNRDYDQLKEAWQGWRDVSGAKMRDLYREFVTLMNTAIQAGGKYPDMGAYYRSWYEQTTFEADVRSLFGQLSPLYDQLHAYVRRKLRHKYGERHFPASRHIPAHLLGNMWSQSWDNIYDILEPYPGKGRESLTKIMEAKNYNVTHMYRVAEEFFTSLGMSPMPESFWQLSMLEKPADGRDVVCHASAWDFFNGSDFRIKQCTTVTEEQMITVHHEMGHIEYYLEYMHQPYLFKAGANPGFHEGVADIVSLSFQTPEHLKTIGLLDELPVDDEGDINFLFKMALKNVAFLPFGYLIDQWRWSVFRGNTTFEKYNEDWWKLRCDFQGISPPVARSESDFDPGAKYHVPGNTPYIRYFVSSVSVFQWHQALCELIGQGQPLHRCDIYRNRTAGARLQEMLRMGKERPWGEAMRVITRGTSGETDKLDAGALLGYFAPLQAWLEKDNLEHGETVGWVKGRCPDLDGSSGVAPSVGMRGLGPLSALACLVAFYLL